jgi:cytochrome c oxidase assembly protein subunit 11
MAGETSAKAGKDGSGPVETGSGLRGGSRVSKRDQLVAFSCAAFVAAMLGAAYAAVPLYDLFCRATGFGGRPVVAAAGPGHVSDRMFEIRFDSNVNGGLSWKFQPEAPSISVKAGEVKTVYFRVTNASREETHAIASYNVTPEGSAPYFSKIQCFCFSEQSLGPGQSADLPVVFFVDPAISKDHDLDSVSTITLSYTFFPAAKPATPVAAAASGGNKPKL